MVARRQLALLGLSGSAVERRIADATLHPLHRGVYAVGHTALTQRSRWMAATLAGGGGAVLSHRSAAALWNIVTTSGAIEVTRPTKGGRIEGVRLHAASLAPDELTLHEGIPVTTVPRTLLDLAAVLPPSRLARALHEAELLRLADAVPLAALLARHPGRRGTAALRALLAEEALDTQITRSPLEDDFLAFAREHRLPRPETNVLLEGLEVDVLYRAARLVVELDGRAAHATTEAFERDRARDRTLAAAGWHVVRLTRRQLRDEPGAVAADLHRIAGTQTG